MTCRIGRLRPVAMLALLAAGGVAGCSSQRAAAQLPPERVIAWDGAVPSQLQPRLGRAAARCRASHLRVTGSGFQFASDAAGGTGAVALRNTGPGSCRLTGRPAVRLVGAPRAPAERQVDLPSQAPAFPEVLTPASTLRALPPGSSAILAVEWHNWCVPGAARSRKPLVPPRAVRISLGKGLGSLNAGYNAVPGCERPGQPSTVGVRPFAPSPLPASRPWTTANVTVTIQPAAGHGNRLTGKRGQVARFVIRLRDASAAALRFGRCPLFAEALAPSGQPEVHRLNCGPAEAIPAGSSLFFEMRIRVPASAPLGRNGLFWELDPTGAQYPEAVTGFAVSP
jgi:hypothetical protein